MSGLKRWAAAIIICLLAAAYLQYGDMFKSGLMGQCLDVYMIPSAKEAGDLLIAKNGVQPSTAAPAFYAMIEGKLVVIVNLKNGEYLASEVCMTGETDNPTPVLVES